MTDTIKTLSAQIAGQMETQALNAVIAGFAFASAIAWMDFVRFLISQLVKVPKNGAAYTLLSALFTTLLSILVFVLVSRISKRGPKNMPTPVYAVTA